MEFCHPWFRFAFCAVNQIEYHEIEENQIERGIENQNDENGNFISEIITTSDDRTYSTIESQPVISNAEDAPLILN